MLRLLLLLLPLLLVNPASAETIAASINTTGKTAQWFFTGYPNSLFATAAEACFYGASTQSNCTPGTGYDRGTGSCGCLGISQGYNIVNGSPQQTMACPSGYGWDSNLQVCKQFVCPASGGWTLSGGLCSRADCQPGETRDSNGVCQSACMTKKNGPENGQSAWYAVPVPGSAMGTYCDGGCAATLALDADASAYGTGYFTDGKINTMKRIKNYTGSSCSTSDQALPANSQEASKTPPVPPKKPACGASEGVMTFSTGSVYCVPEATPNSNKPVVKKEQSRKDYSDGSAEIQEKTTTRDPSTGAEHVGTQTTRTPATGGGAGQAGTPGTTTEAQVKSGGTNSSGTPDGSGQNDLCAKNPTLDLCTGKLAKEETLGKIKDSLSAENFDPASHFTVNGPSDDAKSYVNDKLTGVTGDINKFGTASDPSAGSYQTFKDQMGNWIEPLPASGCSPFTVRVGSWVWVHDHCQVAAKISEIGAYCMWVLLAFGVFGMTTRDHR